jgi:ketosteroid isomerase-like protein
MSQENVEIARRALAAFEGTGDQETLLLELCAEDIVWDVSRSDFPDKRIYHGLEGVREWMRGLDDAFGPPLGVRADHRFR